jgi:hypothetical protein
MQNDYNGLWSKLGLNLENHAGLLGVLSDATRPSVSHSREGQR